MQKDLRIVQCFALPVQTAMISQDHDAVNRRQKGNNKAKIIFQKVHASVHASVGIDVLTLPGEDPEVLLNATRLPLQGQKVLPVLMLYVGKAQNPILHFA